MRNVGYIVVIDVWLLDHENPSPTLNKIQPDSLVYSRQIRYADVDRRVTIAEIICCVRYIRPGWVPANVIYIGGMDSFSKFPTSRCIIVQMIPMECIAFYNELAPSVDVRANVQNGWTLGAFDARDLYHHRLCCQR